MFFEMQTSVTFAEEAEAPSVRQMLAQKLLIDLRYFCDDANLPTGGGYCQQPLTSLPPVLSDMLIKSQVGGVILFSENLQSAEQILTLTHALQSTTLLASKGENQPLYIAVDQEGGRVSRLPNDEFLGFSGNMAIGASFQQYGDLYATEVAKNMSRALYALGFNVNFAPSLDVNSNPANPIINVRAFSQSPQIVATLGAAQIRAYQQHNIAAAAKHFPGHGDTVVDSHVGLPRVEHSKALIDTVDIYPFKYAIEEAQVDMIMTAHIQYPALDNTTFTSRDGVETELPATLSKQILTGLLREQLQFDGLIVTDALDMAAISQFLNPVEATIMAFEAGADIALMPFRISSEAESVAFIDFIDELSVKVTKNEALKQKVAASYARIIAHKKARNMQQHAQLSLAHKQKQLEKLQLSSTQHALGYGLGSASFSVLKPLKSALLPEYSIYAVMPDKRRCDALLHYLRQAGFIIVTCVSQLSQIIDIDKQANVIIVGDVTPSLSFFESKAFEGISANQRKSTAEQQAQIARLLEHNSDGIKLLFKLRSPYISAEHLKGFDAIFASYDYQVSAHQGGIYAPAFKAFTEHVITNKKGRGVPPVKVLLP